MEGEVLWGEHHGWNGAQGWVAAWWEAGIGLWMEAAEGFQDFKWDFFPSLKWNCITHPWQQFFSYWTCVGNSYLVEMKQK
jgi:hypothetical protein